jgi:hypothetical protein
MDCKDKYISDLESEIQYLKKLLEENGISYDYDAHLRALQSDVGDIVFPELGPEHANLLYSYFKGRPDVYALRSSKKGYYTQCNNFWKFAICPKRDGGRVKCQDCPSKDYKELKGRVILQHLQGLKELSYHIPATMSYNVTKTTESLIFHTPCGKSPEMTYRTRRTDISYSC